MVLLMSEKFPNTLPIANSQKPKANSQKPFIRKKQ
jgi:hypothetical protein